MPIEYRLRSAHIFVGDLDRARAFYADTLGLRLTLATPEFLIFDTGECGLMVFSNPNPSDPSEVPGGETGLHLGVQDIEAAYRELSAKGVPFTAPPHSEDWGGTLVSFLDPDDNHMTLVQYPD